MVVVLADGDPDVFVGNVAVLGEVVVSPFFGGCGVVEVGDEG